MTSTIEHREIASVGSYFFHYANLGLLELSYIFLICIVVTENGPGPFVSIISRKELEYIFFKSSFFFLQTTRVQ